ncbi:MAG: DUF6311 domain-containing protein [Pseudomonadota bacterium]|nr:DUF6311 domain-containing protein [Pseudomonadota bacterium]
MMHAATVGTGEQGRISTSVSGRSFRALMHRHWLKQLATPLLLLLLPLGFFLAFFHPATLQIGNPGWLLKGNYNSDNGENALGAHAYWHDRAAGASLRTTLLSAPDGVPVLFTDSNPLVTLAVKPFAKWLPADAQLVGPFILFSLILQTVFAWLLLRHHAPGAVALWAGILLLAFPPTLANRFIHANLMAHWTILAALYLFLQPKRGQRLTWWALLITITALIHSYLLIMVGAIWASAMLVRFVDGSRITRVATLADGAAVLALVATLAWWLGVGDQMTTGSFGHFSMPLDALWNPGLRAFSTLLPSHDSRGGDWFEGFQYLGAGGLLLIAAAIIVARHLPARDGALAVAQRLRGLGPALIVLAILAIVQLPLPTSISAILDPVRASGRLFWPVGYVLILMAILAVFRLSNQRAGLVLVGVVALQIADLAGMANTVRAQSAPSDRHHLYDRTRDPRWAQLIDRSSSIAFMPGDVTRDLGLFQEVSWRAINAGRPVANVYAARTSRATVRRLAAERAAFARGELVPGRLYVMLPGVALPTAAAPRLLKLNGMTVIAPLPSR